MNNFLTMSPVILAVLGLLVIFSIASWAIIVHKLIVLRTIRSNSKTFIDFFWTTGNLASVDAGLSKIHDCPTAAVFQEGWRETRTFLGQTQGTPRDIGAMDSVDRCLRKTASEELGRIERDLGFLATTASTTPFIGLFGTVWGIMNAFQNIGQAGSTSLAVVAPGISEALVTTAIGLAAAIPASIGYNHLRQQLRKVSSGLDRFCSEFLNIVQKLLNKHQ
jgi:biopolymer transport protein TolQ